MNIGTYWHTIKYLKGKQLFYQLLQRFRPLALKVNLNGKYDEKRGFEVKHAGWLQSPKTWMGEGRFRFIGIEKSFDGNWNTPGRGRLWNYNLNYMDYLLQEDISAEEGLKLILDFIGGFDRNTCGKEPYPLSVRCMNWIKFISGNRQHLPAEQAGKIDKALYSQLNALSRNPEYHLLGNHLIMNGVSLLFGAFHFRDNKLFRKASEILLAESEEQILNDGGHFELSPMYHQQILSLFLDCVNLIDNNKGIFPEQEKLVSILKSKISLMTGWLENITLPGGEIPLLNDSALGIYPDSATLYEYAGKLGVRPLKKPLDDSGYRRFAGSNYICIADAGRTGPEYIPGHAHADTFSFVLCIGEKQVVADTGISTYENNNDRLHERGTSAHNTVKACGINSSEVWGSFRVGRRATVRMILDSQSELVAEHDGFSRCGAIHKRHFVFNEDQISIHDELTGGKDGVFNLHFHPDRSVHLEGNKIILDCCIIMATGFNECRLRDYKYHPGFNLTMDSIKFEGLFTGSCSIKIITG